MRAALRGGLLLAVLTAIACGSSTTAPRASFIAVPSVSAPSALPMGTHYLLSVTSSLSCDRGAPFAGTFDFDLVARFPPSGDILVQPNREMNGPNSGSVMLMVLPGVPAGGAVLSGSGLAADGVHIVSFGWNFPPPLEGYAFLFPTAGAPPNEMTGDLQNAISMGVSASPAANVCFAAANKYKLTPKS